jgi:hypothetical protein
LRVRLLFAGLLALPFCGYAEAPLRAEQIGEQNFESTHIGGPDAIGGIGDWYLANDVVEVVVDAPSRRHAKLNHGGTIVDAGRLDRENEDQFARLIPIANFSQRVFVGYDTIRAEVDEERGSAQLVVTSPGMQALPRGSAWSRFFDPMVPDADALSAVEVETRYEVRRAEPFVRITTNFENTGEADAPLFSFGEFWMRGLRAKRAFTGHTLAPEEGKGFVHRAYDHHQPESALPALAALTHVVAPGVSHFPPISYAIVSPERASRALPFLGLTAEHINVMLGLVGDEPFRGRGVMALLRGILTGELAPGERWTYERRLVIGPEADVASTTDLVLPMLGVTAGSSAIVGRVAPAGLAVGILVERDDGVPTSARRRRAPTRVAFARWCQRAATSSRCVPRCGSRGSSRSKSQRAEKGVFPTRASRRPERCASSPPSRISGPGGWWCAALGIRRTPSSTTSCSTTGSRACAHPAPGRPTPSSSPGWPATRAGSSSPRAATG